MSVYTGCDYLRLTAPDHSPSAEWEDILASEFTAEENAGRRPHYRWILGYYGRVGEHCFVGKSEQGAMVQVSGRLADVMYYPISHVGGRASRIDLQVTATPEDTVDAYLHEAYVGAACAEKGRGKPPVVELRDTNYGAKMVTIGSRQSEVFGRIYDKHKESKDDFFKGMVRLEIEVKGQEARDLHGFLQQDKMMQFHATNIVAGWYRKRGVRVFWEEDKAEPLPERQKRNKSDATKLAWIQTQVRPTLGKLLENGKEKELAAALLPDDADNITIATLALMLSRVKRGYAS